MTQDKMRESLRMHIALRYKRQRNAARRWGVSDAYISSVLLGKKRPSQKILDEIGLREKITVEYVSNDDEPKNRAACTD